MIDQETLNANRKKWIEALESGEYEQGRGALNCYSQFCCLGVAASIFAEEDTEKSVDKCARTMYDGEWAYAPKYVIEAVGLVDRLGSRNNDVDGESLSFKNDSGMSFNEIADLLKTGQYWKEDQK